MQWGSFVHSKDNDPAIFTTSLWSCGGSDPVSSGARFLLEGGLPLDKIEVLPARTGIPPQETNGLKLVQLLQLFYGLMLIY